MNDLAWAQRNLRYAAMNDLYPGLITAHLVDVPRNGVLEITAYLTVDSKVMRVDASIDYVDIEKVDNLVDAVINIIDLRMKEFKEQVREQ